MLALIMTLSGMAAVESLNVMNLGLTSAIILDSRLHRRSPLPGGLGFLAGMFASAVTVGIMALLGVDAVTRLTDFDLTPTLRYRGELVTGVLLIGAACYRPKARKPSARTPFGSWRRSPSLLTVAGAAIGFVQAGTDVMYLAAVAMLAAHHPRPALWPAIVAAYCAIALWPPLLVLFLTTRRTARARRIQRGLVRAITRYGPTWIRAMCVLAGVALVVDALWHSHSVW